MIELLVKYSRFSKNFLQWQVGDGYLSGYKGEGKKSKIDHAS